MKEKQKSPDIRGRKRKAAQLLANPEVCLTPDQLCEQAGIPKADLYRWLAEDEFKEYIGCLIESFAEAELINVWKAIIKKAAGGDVSAQKLYFELKNKRNQQNTESGDVVIISGEGELDG